MKRNFVYSLVCLIVILAGIAYAAEPISKSAAASTAVAAPSMLKSTDIALSQTNAQPETELKLLKAEVLSKSDLSANFANLKKSDKSIALASDFLVQKGFEAQTKDENFFGLKETYEVSNKTGEKTQETFTLVVQDYGSKSSKDLGAVARVTVEAGNEKQEYTFNLIAPEGNFDKATEYKVAAAQMDPTKLEVVKANSWWSCTREQIRQHCTSRCRGALTECSGTWAQYIACVVWRCGGCYVAKAACCACNCHGWCSWAVGCCHR